MCDSQPFRFICKFCEEYCVECSKCGMEEPHRTNAGKPVVYTGVCESCKEMREVPPLKKLRTEGPA